MRRVCWPNTTGSSCCARRTTRGRLPPPVPAARRPGAGPPPGSSGAVRARPLPAPGRAAGPHRPAAWRFPPRRDRSAASRNGASGPANGNGRGPAHTRRVRSEAPRVPRPPPAGNGRGIQDTLPAPGAKSETGAGNRWFHSRSDSRHGRSGTPGRPGVAARAFPVRRPPLPHGGAAPPSRRSGEGVLRDSPRRRGRLREGRAGSRQRGRRPCRAEQEKRVSSTCHNFLILRWYLMVRGHRI